MLSKAIKTITTYVLILMLATVAFGQQNQGQTQNRPDPQYVDFTGFKGKVFEVKHRDPVELRNLLTTLGSGFKGATISADREFKTLVVRDFPENIAAIEEALKRLDVPAPPKQEIPEINIELHLHALIASNIEGATNQRPQELNDALKQLQTTLTYKNYYVLSSIVQRAKATANFVSNIQGSGTATAGAPLFGGKTEASAEYSYLINGITLDSKTGGTSMSVRTFNFSIKGATVADEMLLGKARVDTNLSLRDGEQVVVGTASLKDKALILVLSIKVLK